MNASAKCFKAYIWYAGTIIARSAVFPVIVKGQREAAKLNNVMPQMSKLTSRMNEAKQSGNKFECWYLIISLHFFVPFHFAHTTLL